MKHNLLKEKPRYLLKHFLEDYNELYKIDFNKTNNLIKEAINYYNGKIEIPTYVKELEDKWYNSLNQNL